MEENSIKPFYCRQKRVIKVAEEKTKSPRNSYCLDIYSEINLKHLQEHNNTKYRTLIHKLHMKKIHTSNGMQFAKLYYYHRMGKSLLLQKRNFKRVE